MMAFWLYYPITKEEIQCRYGRNGCRTTGSKEHGKQDDLEEELYGRL